MEFGVCIHHSPGPEMERAIAEACGAGFFHCQLKSWRFPQWHEAEASRVSAIMAKNGMKITAFWCGWEGPRKWTLTEGPETAGLVPPAYREIRVKNMIEGAAFASLLGVRDIVTHIGFVPENASDPLYPGFVSAIRHIAEVYAANGQNLLFETGQETPTALLRLIEDVGLGNLYVNFDPANLMMYGKGNAIDALELLGPYIRAVHAKDGFYPVSGRSMGLEAKLGEGKADFKGILRRLMAVGYQGTITIEREAEGVDLMKETLEARDLMVKWLAELEG